ncbi:hypothetical protein [Streptomyces sp. NPDC090798]|uniref:hypothetical protein n=1 Tax=Streptomyces sp. NPDC090798 TaxID=3365968 RepID=UPI00382AD1DB
MDEHGRREYDEFALQGGVAVEKLAKAVLVSKNPLYIAEIRNADTFTSAAILSFPLRRFGPSEPRMR